MIGDFYSIIILSREALGEAEANERSHEAQKEWVVWPIDQVRH
jgi:hypothetical protein